MTTVSMDISKLAKGQKVTDWRLQYEAGVSLFEESQKIALLPSYVHRTAGELEIAKIAAKEQSLDAAINLIELLIDGPQTSLNLVNDFCDLGFKKDSEDLQSLFFL